MNGFKVILLALVICVLTSNAGHAQPLQRVTVFVQNPTSGPLSFAYRMGGDDWRKYKIQSGHTLTMTGIANHYVRYDNGRGVNVEYRLTPGSTNYFSWSRGTLYLQHR
jgi:hypothetical protein